MTTTDRTPLSASLWLLVFAAAAINLRAPIVVIGPLLDSIMQSLALSASMASLLSAGMVICFGILSPVAPLISARIGLDRAIALALAAIAVGGALRGLDQFDAMLIGTLLAGAGVAFGNVFMPSLVKRDRPNRVGPAMGLYTVVMGIGATLAAGTAIPLMEASGSWSTPLWLWAGVALIGSVGWSLLSWRNPGRDDADSRAPVFALLKNRSAWLLTIYMGIQSLGYYTLQAWIANVVIDAGVNRATAGTMLSVINLMTIPASYVVARLAARLPQQSALTVALTLTVVIAVAGLTLAPMASPMLWAVLLGFGQGGCFSLALTLIVLRTQQPQHAAMLSAMVQSIGYTIAAAGPLLFGVLHGLTGTWSASLFVLLGLLLIQTGTGFAVGRPGVIVPEPSAAALPSANRHAQDAGDPVSGINTAAKNNRCP